MASDDDEDLEALRNAVLASMKNRPKDASKESVEQPVGTIIGSVVQQKKPVLPSQTIGKPVISISKRNTNTGSKQFSKKVNMRNLIVLTTEPESSKATDVKKSESETKPALLRPQDKWDLPTSVTSSSPVKTKGNDKFSRFDSGDSESGDSSGSDSESDNSNNVTTEKDGDESSTKSMDSDSEQESDELDLNSTASEHSDSESEDSVDESAAPHSNSDEQHSESELNDSVNTSTEVTKKSTDYSNDDEIEHSNDDEIDQAAGDSGDKSVTSDDEELENASVASDESSQNNPSSITDGDNFIIVPGTDKGRRSTGSEDNKENFLKHENSSVKLSIDDDKFDYNKQDNQTSSVSHKSKQEGSRVSPKLREIEKHSSRDRTGSSQNHSSSSYRKSDSDRRPSLRKHVLEKDFKHSRYRDNERDFSQRNSSCGKSKEKKVRTVDHTTKNSQELSKMEERRRKFENTNEIPVSKGTISLKEVKTKSVPVSKSEKGVAYTERTRKTLRRRSSESKKATPQKNEEQDSDADSDLSPSKKLQSSDSESDSDNERVTWRYNHTGRGNDSSGSNPSGPLFERKREDLEREKRLRRLEISKKKHVGHHKSKGDEKYVNKTRGLERGSVMTSLDTHKTMLHRNKVFVDEELSDSESDQDRKGPISVVKPNSLRTQSFHHRLGARPSNMFRRTGDRQTSDFRRQVNRHERTRGSRLNQWNRPESENSDDYGVNTLVVPSSSKTSVQASQSKQDGRHYILTVKEEPDLEYRDDSSESDGPVVNVVISGKRHFKQGRQTSRSVHDRLGDSSEGLSVQKDRSYKRKKQSNEQFVNKVSKKADYVYEAENFSEEEEIVPLRRKKRKMKRSYESDESDDQKYKRKPVKMPNEIELDERIKKIQEKNAAYKKRRQEILLDKKIYG